MRVGDATNAAPAAEVTAGVGGSAGGLSSSEAVARLRRFGPNELAAPRRFEALREIGRYLASPLVLILLIASGVSAALGEPVSSTVIALMLVLGVALDFTQAYRSQRAARRLRERVGQVATVVRDGVPGDRPAREIVPGDVIHLAAGDLVPADARLLSARDLFVSEAALTGESLPCEKRAEAVARVPDAVSADTAVFRGTSVVSGFGTAVIVRTGAGTDLGRVAAHLSGRPPETEFERGTRRFGLLILEVVIFLVLFVFLVNALLRRDPLQSFLFAVALAVGLTPEMLPMIVSVTLASGAVRTAHRKVVAKRLAAIENLGSMDILCSDKIGTLTRGEATIDRHVNLRGSPTQKNRIVQALRSRGHVVGYVGDGINDAPALRSADVGISVEHAVDVARDAADIILLEKRLDVLHDGVVEGRRSFGNIMKYVLMGTSSNFGNMVSIAAASAVLPFLPMLPLQILLNNFLYDLSQMAIPSDRVDRSYLLKPRRWNVAFIRRYVLVMGPVSSVFDLLTFAVMLFGFHAGPELAWDVAASLGWARSCRSRRSRPGSASSRSPHSSSPRWP